MDFSIRGESWTQSPSYQGTPHKDSKDSGNLDPQPLFWYLGWYLFRTAPVNLAQNHEVTDWYAFTNQSSMHYSLQTVLFKQIKNFKFFFLNSNCMYNQIHSNLKGITSGFNLLAVYLFMIPIVFTRWWWWYTKIGFSISCRLPASQKIP